MQQNKDNRQNGNVFIIIMAGVFLFGALMYSFTRSGEQGTGNLTKQQSNIAAQEILNYARLVEGAVDRVRRNGCSESEISFENDVVAGYENLNSPTDKSCHIFDNEGGKISYMTPPKNWNDRAQSGQDSFNELYINGRTCISLLGGGPAGCADGGKNYAELILNIPYLTKELCENINNQVFSSSVIPKEPANAWLPTDPKFIGQYRNGAVMTYFQKRSHGCFEGDSHPSSGTYHFYHVLLAR